MHVLVCHASHASRGFGYEDDNSGDFYKPSDWDRVSSNEYYTNHWERFISNENGSEENSASIKNECGSSSRQSPIDIENSEKCRKLKGDDDHRWWMDHGNCEWPDDLHWSIESWGLKMEFPSGDNRCETPNLDSSGGYADRFYAHSLMVKTPSEHAIKGEHFDAEIQLWHSQQQDESSRQQPTPFAISILVDASSDYPDNPVLEPYVREWQRTFQAQNDLCSIKTVYPTANANAKNSNKAVSNVDGDFLSQLLGSSTRTEDNNNSNDADVVVSTAASTKDDSCQDEPFSLSSLSTAESTPIHSASSTTYKKIMFDVSSNSSSDSSSPSTSRPIYLTRLDIAVGSNQQQTIQLLISSKNKKDQQEWTNWGSYRVRGSNGKVTLLLDTPFDGFPQNGNPITLRISSNISNLKVLQFKESEAGLVQLRDDNVRVRVGSASSGSSSNEEAGSRGFLGTLYYDTCDPSPSNSTTASSSDNNNKQNNNGSNNKKASASSSSCLQTVLSTIYEKTGGEGTDHEGIMFDVSASARDDNDSADGTDTATTIVKIFAFGINVQRKHRQHSFKVFTKIGSHVNHVSSRDNWIDLGLYDNIEGRGEGQPSILTLNEPVLLTTGDESTSTQAFYIVQVTSADADGDDGGDVQNVPFLESNIGHVQAHDAHLNLHVGTAIEGAPFSSDKDNSQKQGDGGRGFSGNIYYDLCQANNNYGGGGRPDNRALLLPAITKPRERQRAQPKDDENRKLDHGPRDRSDGPFQFAIFPRFDIYRLLTSPVSTYGMVPELISSSQQALPCVFCANQWHVMLDLVHRSWCTRTV
jgi:hypothetical protein